MMDASFHRKCLAFRFLMIFIIAVSSTQADFETVKFIFQLKRLYSSIQSIKNNFQNVQELSNNNLQELKNENIKLKSTLSLHKKEESSVNNIITEELKKDINENSTNKIDIQQNSLSTDIIKELNRQTLEIFDNLTSVLEEVLQLQEKKIEALNKTQITQDLQINKQAKQIDELSETEVWTKSKLLHGDARSDILEHLQNQQSEVVNQQSSALRNLQDKVIDLAHILQNGIFVWKIKKFSKCFEDAKSEKNITVYSRPFYTSPYGYKIRLSLYPNGNGAGEDSHISVFFHIMKGSYDDILKWPFSSSITFMLLDQKSAAKSDYKLNFSTNPSLTYFQKPETEINPGYGYGKFYSLKSLKNSDYILNDTIYIKFILKNY